MRGRVNGAGVLAVIGAAALLVGLFLNWFEPGITAWNAFEIVDLLLAAIAVGVLVVALAASSDRPRVVALAGWLPIAAAAALVLVVVSLLNPPPAVGDGSPDTGAWVSLAGAALLVVGAVLATTEFSLVVTVRPRRGERVVPVEDTVPPAADPGWEPPVPGPAAEAASADTPQEEPFEEPLEAPPLEEPPLDEPVEEPATDEEPVEPAEPTEIDEIIEPGEADAETHALRRDERG